MPNDCEWVQRRPWRKKRGKRRYYRTLARDAADFGEELSGWYDLMHWHVDWDGIGNLSWRSRRAHLAALFTTYERLLAQLDGWSEPHQCWVHIDPADSSFDAVYLHTKNPNRDNFPLSFEWVEWDAEIPERLHEFVTPGSLQFGRSELNGTGFIIRRRPAAEQGAAGDVRPGIAPEADINPAAHA